MLEHPQMSTFSCDDCQKWVIDLATGRTALRGGQPQRRAANQPTPCRVCPRVSPSEARHKELTVRNLKTLVLYLRNRALFGRALTKREARDRVLQKNFGLIDIVLRRWEQGHVAESLGLVMQRLIQ